MTDLLNGATILLGAASAPMRYTFTRNASDVASGSYTPTVFTDAAIELRIFAQDRKGAPASATPAMTLSVGSGLTRGLNTATATDVTMQLSAANLATLLGTAEAVRLGYVWAIRPAASAEFYRAFLGGDYDGYFVVAKQGYGGAESVKVA
jgi:hypothetical protein